jgi:hypothetical protein
MRIYVTIPAYHAGKDYPERTTEVSFPGIPPEGTQLAVMGQDENGVWCKGIVRIGPVRVDPGWTIPHNVAMADNLDDGYLYAEVPTSWVMRPGGNRKA